MKKRGKKRRKRREEKRREEKRREEKRREEKKREEKRREEKREDKTKEKKRKEKKKIFRCLLIIVGYQYLFQFFRPVSQHGPSGHCTSREKPEPYHKVYIKIH